MRAKIRPLIDSDIPSLARVIAQVKIQEFRAELELEVLTQKESQWLMTQIADPRACFLIVKENSQIVGGGGVVPLNNEIERTCELTAVFLLPEARRQGLGRAIVLQCLKSAKKMGFQHCYLETLKEMIAARRLYSQLGFVSLPRPLKKDTPEYLCCWMSREL